MDDQASVEALVERVRDDDEVALDALLRHLLPSVRRWLHRLLGPRGSLDDATQEVLIALARALPRFEGASKLETYAYRITLRVAHRHLGRERRAPTPLALVPTEADAVDPESRVMSRQLLDRLYTVLDRLDADQRVAFVLCAIEGRPPREAAELCEVAPGTMRVRLHRARREVERRLGDDPLFALATRRSS